MHLCDKRGASAMTGDGLFETTSIPGHLAPTPERLERLLSKQTLEELYEVEEQPFARGKYATVRRCRERSSGRQWAAKFLRKRRRAQELRVEALHEVAVLDAAAHCPRLVSLHQVFETNTEMVLVLEMAPGGELQMVLDKDEIPEERQAARFLRQILDGVAFLHSLNVAHLDIKPQNLVLTGEFPDCDVKLCDFGISRYISQGADIREILGTPDYVAPEVLNYEPISLATDMWSVGVLLYVLLTGCSPFGGDTKQETFCNISRCRLDFPDDLFEDVSEEAKDLMRRLIVKNPNQRMTASECLEHPWFALYEDSSRNVSDSVDSTTVPEDVQSPPQTSTPTLPTLVPEPEVVEESKEEVVESTPPSSIPKVEPLPVEEETPTPASTPDVSPHTEYIYLRRLSAPLPRTSRHLGISSERRNTFKKSMDYLAAKFSASAELVEVLNDRCMDGSDPSERDRSDGSSIPMSGEVFKCTPVFILGEEQQCSDSGSDTVSEISTDSSSDRSSIYSDDSLDFILYGKSQGRASFPFGSIEMDRWKQTRNRPHQTRVWPRECNGAVSKALSRFGAVDLQRTGKPSAPGSSSPTAGAVAIGTTVTALSPRSVTGLEALRNGGGNLVVIREPVRAGRYTRYSEVQCESVQARIRRFQVHGTT